MKKWIKYLISSVCIALFLFLMLPFITPPSLADLSADKARLPAAIPQIFTANPLTELVGRLAHIFGRKTPFSRSALAANDSFQPGPQILWQNTHANAGIGLPPSRVAEALEADVSYFSTPFPGSIFGDPDEEWVLIRQLAPQGATGMHEISVRDNAYNRYVKQERLARVLPTARTPVTQLAQGAAASGKTVAPQTAGAAATYTTGKSQQGATLSASDQWNANRAKQPRNLPQAQDVHQAFGNVSGLPTTTAKEETARSLNDLINYSDKTDRAAELVASTAVTGATSPKQQQQKQAIFAAQQALFQQTLTDRERARMISLSQGQAPQDLLPKTALCDVDKGLVSNQEEGCALQLTEEDIQRLRAENQAAFLAQTNTPMPTGKLTPVLGVADAQTLPQIQDDPDFDLPEQLETKEIYRFMLQQQDCSNNSCFWVANSKQIKPDLSQTIDATGQDFEGDPLHKYDKIKADFTASKLASLPPDATQQQRELAQSQADRSAPPYIPYTLEDMDQWGQRLNQPPSPEGPAAPTMFVATTPDARVLAERWNYSTPFFYGQNAQVLTGDGSSVQDRSARLIQDMADYVVFRRESAGQITQTAASQAAQNLVAPIAQDIQNRLKDPSRKLN